MADELGPFQDIWNAWNESDGEIRGKPIEHFDRVIDIQFDELNDHLAAGRREKAANEAIDIISIALNLLRRLGHDPEEIAVLARSRAKNRMSGQTREILDKLQRQHGV
jgi:hypothetical protein